MKKILVTKEKGGVASTTTAVNLATVLAERGHTVLLVDMDTRGDCAACLGLDPWPGLKAMMCGALDRGGSATVGDGLEVARPGLHLVPTNTSGLLDVLHEAEKMPLAGLANLLNDLGDGYDFVIFDTSAASGRLRVAAMQVADLMIVPTRVEALGMPDIAGLIEALRQAQDGHLQQIQGRGTGRPETKPAQVLILPVAVRRRPSVHTYNLRVLQDAYGECMAEPIPDRVAVIESHSAMIPVVVYAPKNEASKAYQRFADRVLKVLDGTESGSREVGDGEAV